MSELQGSTRMKRTGSFAAFDDFLQGVEDDEKRRQTNLAKVKENRRRMSDLSINGHEMTRAESFRSNDSSNMGDSTREEEDDAQDVRETLFSYIPDAFQDDVHFQRVIITESQELVNNDTKEARLALKRCMQIRDKWLGQHPEPPQGIVPTFISIPSHVSSQYILYVFSKCIV